MQKYQEPFMLNAASGLRPVEGANVRVYLRGTTVPAALFSDNVGTPLDQPLTTLKNGTFPFYAANGEYTLSFSGPGFAPFTAEIELFDADDFVPESPGGAITVGFQQAGEGAVTRSVQDELRERVSVKQFGAKGDGVTDDTAAIQAAVSYVAANGGVLHLPPGTYGVTSKIIAYAPAARFSIVGAGRKATKIKRISDFAASVMEFRQAHGICVSDFAVDGQNSIYPNGNHALVIYDSDSPVCRNIETVGFKSSGILMYGPPTTRGGGRMYYCTAYGMGVAPVGLLISDMYDSGMHGCSAYGITNLVHGSDGYGLELKNTCSGCFITDFYAEDCTVAVAFGQDIATTSVVLSRVTGVSKDCNFAFVCGYAERNDIKIIADMTGAAAGEQVIDIQSNSKFNTVEVNVRNIPANKRGVRIRAGCTDNLVRFTAINGLPTSSVVALLDAGAERNRVIIDRMQFPAAGWANVMLDNSGVATNTVECSNVPFYESLTIAAGVVTLVHANAVGAVIDTEAAAAADDLDTIAGTFVEGRTITIRTMANARDVTVRHNIGNIMLNGAASCVLDGVADTLTLRYNAALAKWCEISRSNNA